MSRWDWVLLLVPALFAIPVWLTGSHQVIYEQQSFGVFMSVFGVCSILAAQLRATGGIADTRRVVGGCASCLLGSCLLSSSVLVTCLLGGLGMLFLLGYILGSGMLLPRSARADSVGPVE